jgi:glutathione-regulated potassium-efflux system ancillary protein KefG
MDEAGYEKNAKLYGQVLGYLENIDLDIKEVSEHHYFNDWIKTKLG